MMVKLLTEHSLVFLSLTEGCTGSFESNHVKMPHCWKSHVTAHFTIYLNNDPCQKQASKPLLEWTSSQMAPFIFTLI